MRTIALMSKNFRRRALVIKSTLRKESRKKWHHEIVTTARENNKQKLSLEWSSFWDARRHEIGHRSTGSLSMRRICRIKMKKFWFQKWEWNHYKSVSHTEKSLFILTNEKWHFQNYQRKYLNESSWAVGLQLKLVCIYCTLGYNHAYFHQMHWKIQLWWHLFAVPCATRTSKDQTQATACALKQWFGMHSNQRCSLNWNSIVCFNSKQNEIKYIRDLACMVASHKYGTHLECQ